MGDGVNIAARLEGVAKPGAICLSEDAYRQVKARLDLAVTDLGPTQLKNIAEPIRAYALQVGVAAPPKPAPPPEPARLAARQAVHRGASVPEHERRPKAGIFRRRNGRGHRHRAIAIKWLFVIARNSSFAYKGKAVDIRQVGRELGVRYVLEGGVRKAGNRLRITAQLIEAETGAHLWADRYDGAIEDVFDLQDQITEKVVGVVEPSLQRSEIERSRRKRPENLDAYDLYLQALPHVTLLRPEEVRMGAALLEKALKIDPNYAVAHALVARCHEIRFMQGGFDEDDKIAGLRHADAAIAGGADDSTALAFAAVVISQLSKDHPVALNVIGRALSLNPSSAMAHFMGAQIHALAGDAPGAITHANRALRLSPFDPWLIWPIRRSARRRLEARYVEGAEFYARAAQSVLGDGPFISLRPWRWRWRDGWRKRDTLPDEGSISTRAFGSKLS